MIYPDARPRSGGQEQDYSLIRERPLITGREEEGLENRRGQSSFTPTKRWVGGGVQWKRCIISHAEGGGG